MKRIFKVLFSMLLIVSFSLNNHFNATSGKLKTASICTDDSGTTYGNHGDGHWHVAVKRSSGWYPSGANLGYDNPCNSQRNNETENDVEETEEYIEKFVEEKIEPENVAPVITKKYDKVEDYYPAFSKTIMSSELIRIFGIEATDKEDGGISDKIVVSPERVLNNKKDKKKTITFTVTDSAGTVVEEKTELIIKSRNFPIIEKTGDLTFKRHPKCKKNSVSQYFTGIDHDKNELTISCDNIEIDKEAKTITVKIMDKYKLETKSEYKYIKKSFWKFWIK